MLADKTGMPSFQRLDVYQRVIECLALATEVVEELPLGDGRTELPFAPVEFLRRLATLIPPPPKDLTRYHGVFAPNHRLRSDVTAFRRAS